MVRCDLISILNIRYADVAFAIRWQGAHQWLFN